MERKNIKAYLTEYDIKLINEQLEKAKNTDQETPLIVCFTSALMDGSYLSIYLKRD